MNQTQKTGDIIDTTDCLEAVGVFKGMKNFLFVVAFLCLLLLQAFFWLDRLGFIKRTCPCCTEKTESLSQVTATTAEKEINPVPPVEQAGSEPAVSPLIAEPVAEKEDQIIIQSREATQELTEPGSPAEAVVQPPVVTQTEKTTTEKPQILKLLIPTCGQLSGIIEACNFILIITATVYCLTLLMCIKLSLVGRLGGINHISRAFFISLFALVILMPWQVILPGVVVGTIYTPAELLCRWHNQFDISLFRQIMGYLRFPGMFLLTVLLMLSAQIRSARWAKATLRRLGIIQ